ncbi:transporter substrate-binding domain-containing protein [Catalinimonas niigatensis]|uniref:transporter substrate-binding domain-containing protein n=1 Tax=Catalinimonas niigatensis TaxID=1397264 RepID=UPI002665733D|nr:transporter substrate-binding domain-containing protein [Catalinimonas niigatensis]WPP49306.1 transporter substrate-binding domain-containing protein [Catalinimonas niigatensis]
MRIFLLKAFFLVFHLLILSKTGFGQADTLTSPLERELIVAVHPQAPYIIEGENQTWDGISIQLWRQIAESLQLQYRLLSIPADSQYQALQRGVIDVALLSNISPEKDKSLDFSYFYHTAKLGVAMPQSNKLSSIIKAFFSKRFWQIALMLSALLLIVGAIIYFIERTSNEDNFGGERSIIRGIGAGFWWAGVTMTTIGYGDKAPVTFFGRAVALLWMLIAMAVTAVLTASLVSAMGGSYSKTLTIPEDLRDMKVAAVEDSPAVVYLQKEGVDFQSYKSLKEALKAVKKEELEVAVSSVPILKYTINNNDNLSMQIQAQQLDPQYYALGLREESTLLEPINRTVLQIIKTDQWQEQLERYVPEKSSEK